MAWNRKFAASALLGLMALADARGLKKVSVPEADIAPENVSATWNANADKINFLRDTDFSCFFLFLPTGLQ